MDKEEIVREIKKNVSELNALFEEAAPHDIKFECDFAQNISFGNGKVAHLILNAFSEI